MQWLATNDARIRRGSRSSWALGAIRDRLPQRVVIATLADFRGRHIICTLYCSRCALMNSQTERTRPRDLVFRRRHRPSRRRMLAVSTESWKLHNGRTESFGVEFPIVVQLEARGQLTGVLRMRRLRLQPYTHVWAFTPLGECAEPDEPDQSPVRVVDKTSADGIKRDGPRQVQLARKLRHGQCHDVRGIRWERGPSHMTHPLRRIGH